MEWTAFQRVPATPSPEENTPGKRAAKHAAKFLNVAGVETRQAAQCTPCGGMFRYEHLICSQRAALNNFH